MDETRELRSRTVEWEDPTRHIQRGMTMRPLDYWKELVAQTIPRPPIAVLMGITGLEVEEGRAVFAADPGEEHYNPIGVVHAGLVFTLLDSTMACAVHTTMPQGFFSTLEVKVNFVRSVYASTGRLTCEAKVLHVGKTVATVEGRVSDPRGKLVAHGTNTVLLARPAEGGTGGG